MTPHPLPPDPGLRFYTLAEVAALWRVSPKSIQNWVNAGSFPQPLKVGPRGQWRFHVDTVEQYLRDAEATP